MEKVSDKWFKEHGFKKQKFIIEKRAKNKDYKGILVSSEEFQKQEPHERYSSKDGNGWKMMYSEDLY